VTGERIRVQVHVLTRYAQKHLDVMHSSMLS
jgi:hypothetical protein